MNQQREGTFPLTLFYSYAREDEALRDELEKHFSLLRHQGIISPCCVQLIGRELSLLLYKHYLVMGNLIYLE